MSYIGSTPTTQSFIAGTDYFNGNGSTVNFTLSRSVNSVNDIEVIVNNVEQIPNGYSVSGTTLTFSAAPSAGTSNVYVRYLSTTNLSLAIPAGTSATFNTVGATTLGVTGVATFAAGTAALPAITTTGDTNTGIFFPAADTIAFSEGGVEAMRIDASGNVGIGTSSPTAKLSIEKSADAASPSRTPADYSIRMTAASSNTYNGGVCVSEGTFVNAAITPVDTGSGGAQGWAFITGNNTAIAEAARIDSSGNLLVGTTTVVSGTSSDASTIVAKGAAGSRASMKVCATNDTNAFSLIIFANDTDGQIGSVTQNSAGTVNYNTSSDYRLKENILPMTGALNAVAQLKPCVGNWKKDGSYFQGFIAHELQAVVPDCVTGEKDAVDAEGNPKHQSIDTSFLIATLSAAIQELHALVKTQDSTITALTTRITALENNNATQ